MSVDEVKINKIQKKIFLHSEIHFDQIIDTFILKRFNQSENK